MNIDLTSLVKRPTFIIKLVELLLLIVCVAVVGKDVVAFTFPKIYTVSVAIHGFLIINIICILSYIFNTKLHKYIYVTIAVTGAVLSLTAGSLMIDAYRSFFSKLDYLMSAGVIAIINACVYLVDVFFSLRELDTVN